MNEKGSEKHLYLRTWYSDTAEVSCEAQGLGAGTEPNYMQPCTLGLAAGVKLPSSESLASDHQSLAHSC